MSSGKPYPAPYPLFPSPITGKRWRVVMEETCGVVFLFLRCDGMRSGMSFLALEELGVNETSV